MQYTYPAIITPEPDNTGFNVSFPDVPEALTSGTTMEQALENAADALAEALAAYTHMDRDIPAPSHAPDAVHIPLPPLDAAKLALNAAIRAQGITNLELARRLDTQEGAIRRLRDPRHSSKITAINAAMRALGRTLVIGDMQAAE